MLDLKTACSLGGVVRQRFVLVFMLLMAVVNTYTMRVSLNIALVKMCNPVNKTLIAEEAMFVNDFDWDRPTQGYIKGAFYWGYIITHVPGGMLADRYGAKWILFGGLASTTLFTLIIPVTAKVGGPWALVALRVMTGLGEGVVFPSIGVLLAKWSPMSERSRMGAVTLSGAQLGTVVTSVLTGLTLSAWYWPYTFYFYGTLGILFLIFWGLLVFSLPEQHPYITEKELQYLNETVAPKRKVKPVPWKGILTSLPVWGLVVGQVGHDWGLFTMIHELPSYMHDILHFNIRTNGFLTALPYLLMWIFSNLLGILADYLISRKKLSVLAVRNIWTALASVIPAIGMVAMTFPEDRNAVVAIIAVGMAGMGGYYPGMRINALDITKNYAGTVMALHNGLGAVSGLISPVVIGYITKESTRKQWRIAYILTAAVLTLSCIFYNLVSKAERQYWDYQDDETPPEPKKKRKKGVTDTDDTNKGAEGATAATSEKAPAPKRSLWSR